MSTTKLVEPKAPESDEADEICQDSFALQAGAKFLFLRAIKAHASACERSDEFWRAKQFDGVDELIRYAERLLEMAKAKAEQLHQPEEE